MTVVDMQHLNRQVLFPDGELHNINILRFLVQTQNAEMKAKHGMFLPGVAKLRPTIKKLRAEYMIPVEKSRTWADVAVWMRNFYEYLKEPS
jgi:hypothetical protein